MDEKKSKGMYAIKGKIRDRKLPYQAIIMWLWISFWVVGASGFSYMIYTMLFYTPPVSVFESLSMDEFFLMSKGIFILLAGLGILVHGFSLFNVRVDKRSPDDSRDGWF